MKLKFNFNFLFIALICLLMIQTVSAENRVTNGDFETGDLTGWDVSTSDYGKVEVKGEAAHSGSYGCELYAPRWEWAKIAQMIDLTGVDYITFYFKADGYNPQYGNFEVYIGSDKVYEHLGASDWCYVEIDVSGYTGDQTLWFRANGGNVDYPGDYYVYLDDIIAEAAQDFKNVTFYFIDDSTGEYLQNVWLNYSIDGELYNATFNSGDSITVVNGSSIEIYEAKKYGFVSELEEGGYCLFYTITDDTTIEIHFHPAEGKWHYIELYFQDAETGSLLDDVHLTAKIEYQEETQIIDGIYDYYKTIWVLENSTVLITKAEREGYESELEKEGISLVFIDI
ncbi:hypothetical protein DRP04_11670, partial [Archaeoglobales archaeon]